MAKLSQRLKSLRHEAGLSQQELATQLKCVSKSSINMYERGEREPGLETTEAIADFFNVDLDYLYGRTEIKNRYAEFMKAITEEAKSGRPAAEDEMFRTYGSEHSTNEVRPCEGSKKFGVLYYGVKDNRKTAMDMSGAIATLDSLDGEQLETAKFIIASYFKSSQAIQDIVLTELRPIMEELKHKELAYAEASCET